MNGILRFEQEFIRIKPRHAFMLTYMREALGVESVEWEHLTTLNLSVIRDYIADRVTTNSHFTI